MRASQRAVAASAAPLPDQPRHAERDPDDREQDQAIEERHTHALGGYFLLLFSAIDPPPPSEIALTVAGIDFSASISAHAGQFS